MEQVYEATVGMPCERMAELSGKFPGAVFERYGGVLRVAPGDPLKRGGQIVAHLQESASFSPAKLMESGLPQLTPIAATFSGVAAVTGVLNLGVSVAGFAIMGQRLNQLSTNFRDLQALTDSGLRNVDGKLDRLEGHLLELKFLQQAMIADLISVRSEVAEIGRMMDVDRFAKLTKLLEQVSERKGLDDKSNLLRILNEIEELRHFFAAALEGQCPETACMQWVRDLGYFQAWAGVLAIEARCRWTTGEVDDARRNLVRESARYSTAARAYSKRILGSDSETARFLSLTDEVRPETFVRWVEQLHPSGLESSQVLRHWMMKRDRAMRERGESAAVYLESLNLDDLRARAQAVERLLGTGERLETMCSVLSIAAKQGLTLEAWDDLSGCKESSSPLHLVVVQPAA